MCRLEPAIVAVLVLLAGCSASSHADGPRSSDEAAYPSGPFGIGTPVKPAHYAAWDISVFPDGTGLPAGSGTPEQGEELFDELCAICHGVTGVNYTDGSQRPDQRTRHYPDLRCGPEPAGFACVPLTSQDPTMAPSQVIGAYWPSASTLYDYIRRAMPFWNPQSLTNDEVYALSAYILSLNGLVDEGQVVDKAVMQGIEMPNREGFVPDNRPDTTNVACTEGCEPLRP